MASSGEIFVDLVPKLQPNYSEDLAAYNRPTLNLPIQQSSFRSLEFDMTILLVSVIILALLLGAFIGDRQAALMHHVKSRRAYLISPLATGTLVKKQLSSASAADCSQVADAKSVSKTASPDTIRHSPTPVPGGLLIYRKRHLIFQQPPSPVATTTDSSRQQP